MIFSHLEILKVNDTIPLTDAQLVQSKAPDAASDAAVYRALDIFLPALSELIEAGLASARARLSPAGCQALDELLSRGACQVTVQMDGDGRRLTISGRIVTASGQVLPIFELSGAGAGGASH